MTREPCDTARGGRQASACTETGRRWVLAAMILGSSIAFIDGTALGVALPVVQRFFYATVAAAQWVIESYALMVAALLLIGGAAGDRFGTILAALGLGGLVYGLLESSNRGWRNPAIPGALTSGLVVLALFLLVEMRSRAPMMPLSVFRSRRFSVANLLTFFLHGALNAALIFFPFNLIQVQGYSPTAAGAAFLPLVVIMFLLSRWTGGMVRRWGSKRMLVIGPVTAALGFALLMRSGVGGSYWTFFFPGLAVPGLGMAVSIAPLTTTVMSALPRTEAGIASGVNNAVSRLAALLAIAVVYSILLIHVFSVNLGPEPGRLRHAARGATIHQRAENQTGSNQVPAEMPSQLVRPLKTAAAASFVAGFHLIMIVSAALSILSALCAWLLLER